jgi:hypothetical protein
VSAGGEHGRGAGTQFFEKCRLQGRRRTAVVSKWGSAEDLSAVMTHPLRPRFGGAFFAAAGGNAMAQLILKRASASRPSGEWSEDDYDVR